MTRKAWTPHETALLRAHYPDHSTASVAMLLGCTMARVYTKANALGLHKSAVFMASQLSGRIQRGQQHPNIVDGYFQQGHTPWNKGQHYDPGGRGVETRFKPGSSPHNTLPIGSYRLNKEGHLQQKISDAKGNNSQRWRTVAELVWVQAHGALPPKHLVAFRPGMSTKVLDEITLDRVECISRAENLRRNHPHRKSPEMGRLVQLKGAITRQVNRIAREAEEQRAQHP